MRFLLVGDHRYPFYEEAFSSALSGLGHDVEAFRISRYFDSAAGKLQARIPGWSAAALRANAALLRTARQLRPEVILFWRATHVAPAIYRKLRDATGAFLVAYNNDDPFGQTRAGAGAGWRRRAQWRWYLESLPLVDLALVYRPVNRAEALAAGAPRAEVLMPYFIPERDRPVDLTASERQRFASDVTFAGHYEADGRVEHLAALARAGLHLRLFGGRYWTREVLGDLAGDLHPVEEAAGDDYTKALCGAKMSLCFLSRLNRDSYTRRCFEIPACGSLLLSERTAELGLRRAECIVEIVAEPVLRAGFLNVGAP